MNMKKILSSALVLLMVFSMFAGFIQPIKVEAAYSAGSVGGQGLTVDEIKAIVKSAYNDYGETFRSAED